MHSRRASIEGTDAVRADAAARRLALIAAELGPGDTSEAWWADHTRVAELAPVPSVPPQDPADQPPVRSRPAAAVPVPGRHAARRRSALGGLAGSARTRLPVLTSGHVAVVALAVALGLAVTTWWVVRDDPSPAAADAPTLAEPLVAMGATAGSSPSGAATTGTEGTERTAGAEGAGGGAVTVDVAGKVRRPGIVVLDAGSRVTDALEAAGGAKRGVDLTSLNLARVLVDGEQIVVGAPAGAGPPAPGTSGAAGTPGAPVNLNLATQAELEELPQVGPVTAQAIIAWREERGGFTSVDELLEVDGIGEKSLARLAPLVTV